MTKRIYAVYETTNMINGKFYIGVHMQNGKEYYGSGIALNRAIKMYGKENFLVQILRKFSSKKDAYEFENMIVDGCMVNNPHSYNISVGGNCGPVLCGKDNPRYGTKHSDETRSQMSRSAMGRIVSDDTKAKLSELNSGANNPNFGLLGILNPKYGRTSSKETRKKQSESHKGRKAYNSKKWFVHGKLFYSLKEASKFLDVNYQTISNWCKLYKLPHCYVV